MAKKLKKSAKAAEQETTPIEMGTEPARESEAPVPVQTTGIVDPLGEPADGEGRTYLGDEDALEASEPEVDTAVGLEAQAQEEEEVEEETAAEPQAPAKLERLQKILSQAGIASRRKAEELITEGRVQVNGQVVTELGTKANPARDHIRVDGKLLHGAERHRYFVLNKPKGYVTTVSDPEGRPTVMTFFEKMRERLYPVGRLDYMSEGLLLMTNDGELANRLTKAGSGVEKTYLVKVAGQPAEEELDKLRGGVAIDRGTPGSGKVHTAPARIRQVRQGDNPWYEVVLIEGRNRELRKMFSSIGHFVEKIRRVGYGPLVLDVEPGKLRELEPEELTKLKLAAEGKLRTPKAKEIRRRDREDAGAFVRPKRAYVRPTMSEAPPVESRSAEARPRRAETGRYEARRAEPGRFEPRRSGTGGPRPSGARPGSARPGRPFATGDRGARPGAGRTGEFRPKPPYGAGKPFQGAKPFQGDRPARPAFRPAGEGDYRNRPATGGRFEAKPFRGRSGEEKGRWKNAEGERPRSARTGREQSFERPRREGAAFDRPKFERPRFDRPKPGGPPQRSFGGAARGDRADAERPRPARGNDEFKRPFTPSGGPKRTGGPRPAGKPFRPGGQGDSRPAFRSGPRPPSGAGSRQSAASGSRPASGGPPKRSAGSSSRPPSRGYGKPGEQRTGFKNRGGARSSGPRPGGKRRP